MEIRARTVAEQLRNASQMIDTHHYLKRCTILVTSDSTNKQILNKQILHSRCSLKESNVQDDKIDDPVQHLVNKKRSILLQVVFLVVVVCLFYHFFSKKTNITLNSLRWTMDRNLQT